MRPDPRADLRFLVPARKPRDYLLVLGHPDGGGKAKFFLARGYEAARLEADLVGCARSGVLLRIEATEWGSRLIVRGTIDPPTGSRAHLLTVWQVDLENPGTARFITAHLD